jgi:hypothetical protein
MFGGKPTCRESPLPPFFWSKDRDLKDLGLVFYRKDRDLKDLGLKYSKQTGKKEKPRPVPGLFLYPYFHFTGSCGKVRQG